MDFESLIIILVIGGIAGWLAGLLVKGRGFGIIANIAIGVVGAVIGRYVFGLLGIYAGGLTGSIAAATIGAVILLVIVRLFRRVR